MNSIVTCVACGDEKDVLSLRATADGRLICSECDTEEDGGSSIIKTLIRNETDI